MNVSTLADWSSFHVYYHGDRDLLLREAISEAVSRMVADDLLESMFFVRLSVGGPHIRLRCKCKDPGRSSELAAHLGRACDAFWRTHPSTDTIDGDRIREHNAYIRRFDPSEAEDEVYPDNSWREARFVPEIERYGGTSHFDASLGYFFMSSLQTLGELRRNPSLTTGRRLAIGFRLLVRQAWGMAQNVSEIADLVSYPVPVDAIHEKAAKAYAGNRLSYLSLLKGELLELSSLPPEDELSLYRASRRLRSRIAELPSQTRTRIYHSQLHMTSNRLGLENLEETYLARLVTSALTDLENEDPDFWRHATSLVSEARTDDSTTPFPGPSSVETLLSNPLPEPASLR